MVDTAVSMPDGPAPRQGWDMQEGPARGTLIEVSLDVTASDSARKEPPPARPIGAGNATPPFAPGHACASLRPPVTAVVEAPLPMVLV
jgi:hypothetical protein